MNYGSNFAEQFRQTGLYAGRSVYKTTIKMLKAHSRN
jgi:hypothetical protein